jgi:hypothetical protein
MLLAQGRHLGAPAAAVNPGFARPHDDGMPGPSRGGAQVVAERTGISTAGHPSTAGDVLLWQFLLLFASHSGGISGAKRGRERGGVAQ